MRPVEVFVDDLPEGYFAVVRYRLAEHEVFTEGLRKYVSDPGSAVIIEEVILIVFVLLSRIPPQEIVDVLFLLAIQYQYLLLHASAGLLVLPLEDIVGIIGYV